MKYKTLYFSSHTLYWSFSLNWLFYSITNSYFRYKCEKMILSSCGLCARAKHGWKGHTRIKSLSQSCIEHNFFIRRVQSLIERMPFYSSVRNVSTLRTECEKTNFLLPSYGPRFLFPPTSRFGRSLSLSLSLALMLVSSVGDAALAQFNRWNWSC